MGKKGRRKKKSKKHRALEELPYYDHKNPEAYTVQQIEELVDKIPPLLQTIQADIKSRTNELLLYENEEGTEKEQLEVAKATIRLYHDQQQLFMMMGHITVDQCKKYKSIALEKERLLEEWKRAHGKNSSNTERGKV